MIQNYDIDIQDFLKLTNAGLKVADFVQVKNALIKRYKEVYGTDIDLSTASADGVFVNDLALIINNILQSISTIYSNLNVETASGEYLDILCRLSNISRRQETQSSATIVVKNLNASSHITLPANMKFFDLSGVQWTATNSEPITLSANSSQTMRVICDEFGPVEAPAGYINKTVDASLNVSVTQSNDAYIGKSAETDSELRERRSQSNGAAGTTVLESLDGALRNISGVLDCKIYNNPGSSVVEAPDTTNLDAHGIYVLIRQDDAIDIPDSLIGSTIYNKLTPGVWTTIPENIDVEPSSRYYDIPPIESGSVTLTSRRVWWKHCRPNAPSFSISIVITQYFDADTSLQPQDLKNEPGFKKIAQTVMSYLNSMPIFSIVSRNDIISTIMSSLTFFKGAPTFLLDSVDITSPNSTLEASDYFKYTDFEVSHSGDEDYVIRFK